MSVWVNEAVPAALVVIISFAFLAGVLRKMNVWIVLLVAVVVAIALRARVRAPSPESFFVAHELPSDEAIAQEREAIAQERQQWFAGFRKELLVDTPGREILEVAFAHDRPVDAWSEFVVDAVKPLPPAALIVNFHGLPGGELWDAFGNAVMPALLLMHTRKNREGSLGPCAVVASERKNEMLQKLLEQCKLTFLVGSQMRPVLEITFFQDVEPAVEHLRSRLAS